jgi:hypothetical protein
MRIPVYRSQAAPSNNAPGRSFSVRMNARPFIEAELQKGAILSDLAGQAGEFAKQRYNMIAEAEYNEAALQIEEGMREASYDLSQTSDYRNIFDGKNLWQQQMDSIKGSALSTVSNPRLKKKLENEFSQSEIASRFALQSVVDKKIIAGEQAALAARAASTISDLSKPGKTIEDYTAGLSKLNNAHVPGINSGRFNADKVALSLNKVKKQIAENVTATYVGANPMLAIELMAALETQDRIAAGETVDEQPELSEDAAYVLFALMNSNRDDAMDVLKDSLTTASAFSNALDKEKKAEADAQKFVIQFANNAYIKYSNLPERDLVEKAEVLKFVPGAAQFLTDIPEGGLLSGDRASRAIKDYLYSVNAVTPAMQNVLDRYALLAASPFAEESIEGTFDELFGKYVNNTLTIEDITQNKSFLDREDFIYLTNRVLEAQEAESGSGAETDEDKARKAALVQAKRIAKAKYKYTELNTDDTQLGRASRAAFFNVVEALETEEFNRRIGGNPMTPVEIQTKMNELFDTNEELYRSGLRADMENYIDSLNFPNVNLGLENPLADLDAWWATLDSSSQSRQQSNYSRTKRRLQDYKRQGAF